MKLETSSRMVAAASLTLVVWAFGCNTRTPIGEVPDAGQGDDGSFGDGAVGPGTGGTTGAAGGAGPLGGRTGAGGALAGEGGAPGGHTGAGGTVTGQGGAGGAGGSPAMGGAPGAAACQTHENSNGAAGQRGDACSLLTYPASGFYGDNILADGCTTFTSSVDYELAVVVRTTPFTMQVKLTSLSVSGIQADMLPAPGWYIASDGDWRAKQYDAQTQQQLFQTRLPLSANETIISFAGSGSARIDIYDCDPNTPTRSKVISWAPAQP